MQQQDEDIVREFLIESHENLSRLDQELVELEQRPKDAALLGSIFRTVHTIKGTCGFLGFGTLERITHEAESLLSQLRDGLRELEPSMVSLIFETMDATRQVLAAIEATGEEGAEEFTDLAARLKSCAQSAGKQEKPPVSVPVPASVPEPILESKVDTVKSLDKPEEEATRSSSVADANIRVGVGLLDTLMDLVGELVLTRNQILQYNNEREDAALNATSQRLNLITSELQEGVMKTRMQPIGMVWSNLPRVVRDISVTLGKNIKLDMDGTETELDRTIIEAIKDPLVHLVRNACDHGIERPEARIAAGKSPQGRLSLRAYHEGGQVNIEISDDGAGIDAARVKQKAIESGLLRPEQAEHLSERETLNLIFQAGLSTAKAITNVSGRGVGMDVVKSHIEKIGGTVDVFSRLGQGSTVKLKIPLTLAIIPGLVITSGGERFVIPQVSLLELIRLEGDTSGKHIEYVHGTPVYRRRGALLPIAYLNQVLGLPSPERAEAVSVVVLQAEDRQFGLVVDGINDTQEIVVKPLGKQLKGLSVYAGATIMGDGRVALILDVLGIGQRSGVLAEFREQSRGAADQKAKTETERQRLLLFRSGSFEQLAIPLSLVARLEEFPLSLIEHAGGRRVVQYRSRILPLVTLKEVLEPESPEQTEPLDPAQVIVFNDGDHSLGVVVDQILDVAEEAVTIRQKSGRPGLLGSAVIGKRVADFLDLNYVIRTSAEDWFEARHGADAPKTVLVAEGSAFSRGLIRSGLDMAGYRVVEAANLDEVIRGLEQQPDVVVAAMDLPPEGSSGVIAGMRQRREWECIPVLVLADSAAQVQQQSAGPGERQDCQVKFDRDAMLQSVARLSAALASAEAEPVGAGREK